jgi:hypothetical protein
MAHRSIQIRSTILSSHATQECVIAWPEAEVLKRLYTPSDVEVTLNRLVTVQAISDSIQHIAPMRYGRELQGWHAGEKAVRAALGYDKVPALLNMYTAIEPELPTQHAVFYAVNVAFLPVTSLDDRGR